MRRRRDWLEERLRVLGMSYEKLAEEVGVHPNTVGRWVRGEQDFYGRNRAGLGVTLNITAEELDRCEAAYQRSVAGGLPLPSSVVDPDEMDRLALAARNPARLDRQIVTSLAVLLSEQRHTEDHLGAGPLLPPVAAQLDLVTSLVVDARGPLRPAVVDIAGQWAQFLAWLNTSVGDHHAARVWWDRAAEWAAEAGNATLAANVLSFKGHLAWMKGQVGPTIGLSEAAQRDPAVFVSQRAYDAYQQARGHAMAGDVDAATRTLGSARELAQLAMERPDEKAPWSYYYSPDLYRAEHGLVHLHLSFHDRSHASSAVVALGEGLNGLGEADESDWVAEWRYHLALAHMMNDDPDHAAKAARQSLRIARRTGFDRLTVAISRLHARLAARFPGQTSVAELEHQLAS